MAYIDPVPALKMWADHHAERGVLPGVVDRLRELVNNGVEGVVPDPVAEAVVGIALGELDACYARYGDRAPETLHATLRLAMLLLEAGASYPAGLYIRTAVCNLRVGADVSSADWEAVEVALLAYEQGKCSRGISALDRCYDKFADKYGRRHRITIIAGLYRSYVRRRCGDVGASNQAMMAASPNLVLEGTDRLTKELLTCAWSIAATAAPHTCAVQHRPRPHPSPSRP